MGGTQAHAVALAERRGVVERDVARTPSFRREPRGRAPVRVRFDDCHVADGVCDGGARHARTTVRGNGRRGGNDDDDEGE